MDWFPNYKLYAANGTTPVYTFQYVTNDSGPAPTLKNTEITGIRGIGSIIIGGSKGSWDLDLNFVLIGTNYQDLISQINSLESTIVMNTSYVLKIDLSPSSTKDYNVKRIVPIKWDASLRTTLQRGTITFKVLSW